MFIKLKEQLVSVDSIIRIDEPKKSGDIDWVIKTILDSTKTQSSVINSMYSSETEARQDYNRIVAQLCADKK